MLRDDVACPSLSPDGTRIAFKRQVPGRTSVVPADGSGTPNLFLPEASSTVVVRPWDGIRPQRRTSPWRLCSWILLERLGSATGYGREAGKVCGCTCRRLHVVAYTASIPRVKWQGPRRKAINTLEAAHATMGEVDGPGRPLEIGRPVAHAYVLRVVAEFQAFARDLHDLAVEKIVELSGTEPQHQGMLTTAVTSGRQLDRGNANVSNLTNDFRRIGLSGLAAKIANNNTYWEKTKKRRGDGAHYEDLMNLRNCLAHGNQGQLDRLRWSGIPDTVTWTRRQLPALDRTARALDRTVWDHLKSTFATEPW